MRTLGLIRLALLIFILCWVGYNQSLDQKGFNLQTKKEIVRKMSHGAKKMSALLEESTGENQKDKFQDY